MFPDSNRKGPQNKHDKELVDTLGNPLASEEEWLHANDNLGDFKPKATTTEQRQKQSRHLGEVVILAAMGLGIFGLINFTQPSNVHEVTPPPKVSAVPAVVKDVDFGPYMGRLQRTIKRNWFPPKGNESKRVVVLFSVSRDGQFSKLRLSHSSGVALADQAALRAVENAQTEIGPLPQGSSDSVDIEFTFDYNVFSGGHTPKAATADDRSDD